MNVTSLPIRIPRRPAPSEVERTAFALCQQYGIAIAHKHCAKELALARRSRSRRRYMFWQEVAEKIDAQESRTQELGQQSAVGLDAVAAAKAIAQLASALELLARRSNLPALARLVSLARAEAEIAATSEVNSVLR